MTAHEIEDDDEVLELARGLHRVAVLGIKTEAQSAQPAFYVARYLVDAGVEVVPVPVYFPEVKEILGRPVVRDLKAVGEVDAVVVFRRSEDVAAHLTDLLQLKPRAVWLQLGIRDEETAKRLVVAGINVVQDRCLMVEHRQALARSPQT